MCRTALLFIFLSVGSFLIPLEAVIDEYLKTTVDPCEDFYQYACGRWHQLHPNVLNGDTLSLLDANMNEKVSKLLDSKQEQGFLQKAKTFYGSCRNLEIYNISQFLDIVKPRSGWAISRTWNRNEFNWIEAVAELRKYGAEVFLEHSITPKWDNSSVNIINLDVLDFHFTSEESLKELIKKAYLSPSLVREFLDFEKRLGAIQSAKPDASSENYESEEVVLGYLRETFSQIQWTTYFNTLYDQEMDLYTPLIILSLDTMTKLAEFLDSSKPDVVSNYIMIKFLQFLDKYSFENISPNECVTMLHQSMPLAVDHIIENNFYEHEYDQLVQDLFNYLKVEFLAEVSKLYEDQRDALLFIYTKTSVMEIQIGNSDRNMSSSDVNKYYGNLKMKKDDFYRNVLMAFKFKTSKDLKSLQGEPIHIAYQWAVAPSPMFLHPKNKVIIPLSLLQEDIFGKDITTNKYSVLGFIIAHEFLHGFDLNGINYDYTGSMVQSALTNNPTFHEGVQCIREELGDNGIGEKIADFGGIRVAHNAFQRSLVQVGQNIMGKKGVALRTLGQSFFIDFAQFFCGKTDNSLSKGPPGARLHDSDDLRIKRSLMNFKTFANAFDCPVGSAMNPEKKCRVW